MRVRYQVTQRRRAGIQGRVRLDRNLGCGLSMGAVPILKPAEVCRLLDVAVRQRGSHIQYRHPDGRGTTVPMHKGRDIAAPLLRQIARDIGLTVEELISLR